MHPFIPVPQWYQELQAKVRQGTIPTHLGAHLMAPPGCHLPLVLAAEAASAAERSPELAAMPADAAQPAGAAAQPDQAAPAAAAPPKAGAAASPFPQPATPQLQNAALGVGVQQPLAGWLDDEAQEVASQRAVAGHKRQVDGAAASAGFDVELHQHIAYWLAAANGEFDAQPFGLLQPQQQLLLAMQAAGAGPVDPQPAWLPASVAAEQTLPPPAAAAIPVPLLALPLLSPASGTYGTQPPHTSAMVAVPREGSTQQPSLRDFGPATGVAVAASDGAQLASLPSSPAGLTSFLVPPTGFFSFSLGLAGAAAPGVTSSLEPAASAGNSLPGGLPAAAAVGSCWPAAPSSGSLQSSAGPGFLGGSLPPGVGGHGTFGPHFGSGATLLPAPFAPLSASFRHQPAINLAAAVQHACGAPAVVPSAPSLAAFDSTMQQPEATQVGCSCFVVSCC